MITAKQIADWSGTVRAPAELPRVVRRLVQAVASTTKIAMPGGEAVALPGFDGEIYSETGNAWVPAGHSFWELSVRADVAVKANEDLAKRTSETATEVRSRSTYVALTARRWPGKARWQEQQSAAGRWKNVRALDCDDLEQWFEQAPAVALSFAEELGISGFGVESPDTHLQSWSSQCDPAITAKALLIGRTLQAEILRAQLSGNLTSGAAQHISIRADSVEEATAFVAAALGEAPPLADLTAIITDASGWRFVQKNPQIRIAVAATPTIAESPTSRDGLTIVVPYASGDMSKLFKGVAGRLDKDDQHLERADHRDFQEALVTLGVEENDASRLAALCGRSWSIFRRQHAVNAAIRRPAWLRNPASKALSTLCLVGNWSAAQEADRQVLETIDGRSYAELEADLCTLERLDDSPVVHIGSVWKAKSALELLALFGPHISSDAVDRYFEVVEDLLTQPDPQLELPEEERYAASIHGKVRPTSGLLLEALCDTIIKMAVRGPELEVFSRLNISSRVDRLVRNLLSGASRERWLSLATYLPALAEASPHEFLLAVEDGLDRAEGPQSLLAETNGTGFGSRCWHSGLLWALEVLAWAPQRLKRVSLILTRLSEIPIKGNWGNTPQNTLLDLYRLWLPQTGATPRQRLDAIDYLALHAPDQAYRLLDSMTGPGPDSASAIARPKWRDDDAGAGYGATKRERSEMQTAAIDRQIKLAGSNPQRVATLVAIYAYVDDDQRKRIIAALAACRSATDVQKEEVREGLRRKIHWHLNYDQDRTEAELRELLQPLRETYEELKPGDLLHEHAWLFRDRWVSYPFKEDDDDATHGFEKAAQLARSALREIYDKLGWAGVEQLACEFGTPWVVGAHLPHIGVPLDELASWIATSSNELDADASLTRLVGATIVAVTADEREQLLDLIFVRADASGQSVEWKTRILTLCPHGRSTWDRAEALGQSERFWATCSAGIFLDAADEKNFALRHLLAAGRSIAALGSCHSRFADVDAELLFSILHAIISGAGSEATDLPASYVFTRAIDHLEGSGWIDELKLVQLEFALIRTLGFEGESHARTLYRVLMSRPEVLVEMLCLVYKAKDGGEPSGSVSPVAAENAFHVLRGCERLPGSGKDDLVDASAMFAYIAEARRLATDKNRLDVCDSTIGEILAHSPEEPDKSWPLVAVRDALEHTASDAMLRGFYIGTLNSRGVTSRGAFDGGDQERELADRFHRNAKIAEANHPRVAAILTDLARSYERDGILEDLDARLRRER